MKDFFYLVVDNFSVWGGELLLGAAGAWAVSLLAHRCGLVDSPSERSSHLLPTPKGGGIGILAAFILGCFAFGLSPLFCLSVTSLSLLSLLGDRTHLSASIRLLLQFAVAFLVVFFLPGSSFCLGGQGVSVRGFVELFVCVCGAAVFIVGTANFYNFMDGIDGIAAITGIVGFSLFAGYTVWVGGDYRYFMLSIGLVMACLGFLPFNVPRAQVFMGDVGSILLGVVFASMVVLSAKNPVEFIVFTSFLWPFYADELLTMLERIRKRHNLLKPHRRHLYQVLVNEAGYPHWRVSVGYGAAQLISGGVTWAVSLYGIEALLEWIVVVSVLAAALNFKIKKDMLLDAKCTAG